MTAPASLPNLMWVLLVANGDTPAEVRQYNGVVLGLRGADLTAMGSGPDNPGTLAGIFGYSRPSTVPNVAAEWVMSSPIPQSILAAFEVIAGQQGWLVPAARAVFAAKGQELILEHGLPANVVLAMLQALYPAAIAEGVERFSRGLPLP